jgi:hypothetical protein
MFESCAELSGPSLLGKGSLSAPIERNAIPYSSPSAIACVRARWNTEDSQAVWKHAEVGLYRLETNHNFCALRSRPKR